MKVRQNRLLFWTAVGILTLLAASPALSRFLVFPRHEFFTEVWLLGPDHKAEDYPYNISRDREYTVYLGISNHLGYCGYYQVQAKFRNESQPGPKEFWSEGTLVPSNLPSLFNLSAFVSDLEVWEQPVTFSFNYVYDEVTDRVDFNSMTLNGVVLNMSGYMLAKNPNVTQFKGTLFFEIWLFRNATLGFIYHERFVSLRLNMTT